MPELENLPIFSKSFSLYLAETSLQISFFYSLVGVLGGWQFLRWAKFKDNYFGSWAGHKP
jgi:hypothetical protein